MAPPSSQHSAEAFQPWTNASVPLAALASNAAPRPVPAVELDRSGLGCGKRGDQGSPEQSMVKYQKNGGFSLLGSLFYPNPLGVDFRPNVHQAVLVSPFFHGSATFLLDVGSQKLLLCPLVLHLGRKPNWLGWMA